MLVVCICVLPLTRHSRLSDLQSENKIKRPLFDTTEILPIQITIMPESRISEWVREQQERYCWRRHGGPPSETGMIDLDAPPSYTTEPPVANSQVRTRHAATDGRDCQSRHHQHELDWASFEDPDLVGRSRISRRSHCMNPDATRTSNERRSPNHNGGGSEEKSDHGLDKSSPLSDHSLRPRKLFVLRPWAHRIWTWVGLTREARRRFEDDDVDVCDIRSASCSVVRPSLCHRSARSLGSRQRSRQGFIRFEGRWYELVR